jgi:hypothetical protein
VTFTFFASWVSFSSFLQAAAFTNNTTGSSANTFTPGFIESLDVGSCIDYRADSNGGVWEIAIIEKMTEFRTEIEVCLANGSLLWLSFDRDREKIAPFGTKTSFGNGSPPSAAAEVMEVTGGASVSVPPPLDLANLITAVPEIGTLVDVQDRQGAWYQVRYIFLSAIVFRTRF